MNQSLLKLTVLGALGLASTQVFAAGTLCALPAAPAGSAYINAYNDGRVIPPLAGPPTTTILARSNFGTGADATSAGLCEITALANDSVAPAPGYGAIAVTSRTATIPSVTGGATSIGQVVERIWRKPAATAPVTATPMCILGTKISVLSNTDHDSGLAGTQLFEINDIARGGYSGSGTVGVGYFKQATNASRLYRVGRTYTSVQHRAYKYGAGATLAEQQNNGTGYLDLPTIGGLTTLDINGVNTPIAAGAVATTGGVATLQDAQVNSNWVDFTADSVQQDDDGSTNPVSSMAYVEFACNTDNKATIDSTWVQAGAISLRQTAQENTTFKRIDMSGFAPPGATVP
jgi:hypothetical protein